MCVLTIGAAPFSMAEGTVSSASDNSDASSYVSYPVEVPCPPQAGAPRLHRASFTHNRHLKPRPKSGRRTAHVVGAPNKVVVKAAPAVMKAARSPHIASSHPKRRVAGQHRRKTVHKHRVASNTPLKKIGRCEVIRRDRLGGGLQLASTPQTLVSQGLEPTGALVTQPAFYTQGGQGPLSAPLRDYPIGFGSGGAATPAAAGVKPVSSAPEPGEWMLIVLGVSLIGGQLRQKRRAAAI